MELEVLLSVPCVETMAAAGATKVARRKKGQATENPRVSRPHHAPQLEPLAGEHRQEAQRLCQYVAILPQEVPARARGRRRGRV